MIGRIAIVGWFLLVVGGCGNPPAPPIPPPPPPKISFTLTVTPPSPAVTLKGYDFFCGPTAGGETTEPVNAAPVPATSYVYAPANQVVGAAIYCFAKSVAVNGKLSVATKEVEGINP